LREVLSQLALLTRYPDEDNPMRRHGTLVDWKDSRGFGFIELGGSTDRVFVHVSSFRASSERPRVGLVVSFDTEVDASGRKRAINVMRPGDANRIHVEPYVHAGRATHRSPWWIGGVAPFVLIAAAIAYFGGGDRIESNEREAPLTGAMQLPVDVRLPVTAESSRFQCDGRIHCSEMRSCEEALFFLRYCPGVKMDGDRDGHPCELDPC
jgi:cold shock CspA family protein